MVYLIWILLTAIAMLAPVRLGFGGWHWDAQLIAVMSLLGMWACTQFHRGVAERFLPDDSKAFMLLAANFLRILIGVLAVLVVVKHNICDFHAFLTSHLCGYVFYLSAEIWILTQESP